MKLNQIVTAVALGSATIGLAAPASASTYLYDITINGLSGSGTLTTVGDASVSFSLVNSFTGTFNGSAISLLPPLSYPLFDQNDNLFRANSNFFDTNGLSFAAGGSNYNIYATTGIFACTGSNFISCRVPATFSLREATGSVPEPATWAMMLLGFGAMGVALRRRRTLTTVAQFD